MQGITATGFWVGGGIGLAIGWAIPFSIAYWRRPFGGSAKNYLLAFSATWAMTMLIFLFMALLENSGA